MMLQYYKDVLGLRYLPRRAGSRQRLLVLDLPNVPGGLAANSLFPKMMAAIGLKPEEVRVLELLPSEVSAHDEIWERCPVLSFSHEISEAVQTHKSVKFMVTAHGPRDLEKNPALKKESWTRLQSLIQELSRSAKSP